MNDGYLDYEIRVPLAEATTQQLRAQRNKAERSDWVDKTQWTDLIDKLLAKRASTTPEGGQDGE